MSLDQPTLEEFVRRAERYGSELVYETAAAGYLEPEELGLLSLALQRLDRKWRLAPAQKTKLALALLESPLPVARICEMAQLHRATVHRLRQERQQVRQPAETAPDSAQPCAADVAQTPTPTSDTATPGMRHARA
ncbi:MAG: hypothetical protein KGJ43_00160 [Acidobacteriota bacterium]|nr:hypothetical protein [Acidobacteriota bacterium]